MTPTILHLFPDTNLFAQCRPLEELDWQRWGTFDEVRLIVCRPIQAEIDRQKGKGGDRLARRAKKTSSMFREIIMGDSEYLDVHAGPPQVKLTINAAFRADPGLADQLDYSLVDDQLVGVAHAFKMANPGADVRVLTHDTGPMATAKMIGLTIAPIPDEWLLPPETSESDKSIKALQAENKRLKSAEPEIEIVFMDSAGNGATRLEGEITLYDLLTRSQLADAMERLRSECPVKKDFSAKPVENPVWLAATGHLRSPLQEYQAPSDRNIRAYQDEAFPAWLKACQAALAKLPSRLQSRQIDNRFKFAARNVGGRPAKDALITLRARGNFELSSPERDDDDSAIMLPDPPEPPKGEWVMKGFGGYAGMAALGQARAMAMPLFGHQDLLLNHKRDPNDFYWKRGRPKGPVPELVFECEQWRHGSGPEAFGGDIDHLEEVDALSGALECEVAAENLATPVKLLVPVRMTIKRKSVLDIVNDRIDYVVRLNSRF